MPGRWGVEAPIRLMTRLLAEMQTAVIGTGLRALGGDLDRFTIFTLIVRQSLSGGAAISAHSIANSLSRPYETVRRHIGALVARGLCARTPNGVAPVATALSGPPFADVLAVAHDSIVRFVEDLGRLGVPLPQQRDTNGYAPHIGVQAAADIMLAVIDSNRDSHRDWVDLVIFSTILCGNVRDYARDPVVAWRHADHRMPPPENLRRPVRASVAARVVGLPESTVRRRIDAMAAAGRLVRTSGGLLVSEDWMNEPRQVATSLGSYQNTKRILERLAAAGFPFAAPDTAYLTGRPADVRFA